MNIYLHESNEKVRTWMRDGVCVCIFLLSFIVLQCFVSISLGNDGYAIGCTAATRVCTAMEMLIRFIWLELTWKRGRKRERKEEQISVS